MHNPLWRDGNQDKHSRSKRSVSREHTVELMIVADSKMSEYHGDGLEQYVLSLIAVVSVKLYEGNEEFPNFGNQNWGDNFVGYPLCSESYFCRQFLCEVALNAV